MSSQFQEPGDAFDFRGLDYTDRGADLPLEAPSLDFLPCGASRLQISVDSIEHVTTAALSDPEHNIVFTADPKSSPVFGFFENEMELTIQFIGEAFPALCNLSTRSPPRRRGWLLFLLTQSRTYHSAALGFSEYLNFVGSTEESEARAVAVTESRKHWTSAIAAFNDIMRSESSGSPVFGEILICGVHIAQLEVVLAHMLTSYIADQSLLGLQWAFTRFSELLGCSSLISHWQRATAAGGFLDRCLWRDIYCWNTDGHHVQHLHSPRQQKSAYEIDCLQLLHFAPHTDGSAVWFNQEEGSICCSDLSKVAS